VRTTVCAVMLIEADQYGAVAEPSAGLCALCDLYSMCVCGGGRGDGGCVCVYMCVREGRREVRGRLCVCACVLGRRRGCNLLVCDRM
jgi:hypothetical protein